MVKHKCVHCGKYFYSSYRRSSHELFFHGKFAPIKVLPKASWENTDSVIYEHRKLVNSVKRQEDRVKHIKETKIFKDKRNRRWSAYREILQFELRKLDAMKRSLISFEKESKEKGVEIG